MGTTSNTTLVGTPSTQSLYSFAAKYLHTGDLSLDALQTVAPSLPEDLSCFHAIRLCLRENLLFALLLDLSGEKAQKPSSLEPLFHQASLWKECQFLQAYLSLISHLYGQSHKEEAVFQLTSGAAPLDFGGWLKWGNCPLTGYHEEMGMLWALDAFLTQNQSKAQAAKKLLVWERQWVGLEGLPIKNLFCLEEWGEKAKVLENSYALFTVGAYLFQSGEMRVIAENIWRELQRRAHPQTEGLVLLSLLVKWMEKKQLKLPDPVSLKLSVAVCDPHSSVVGKRWSSGSAFACLYGGYTGLGSLKAWDVGVLNYGPQSSSLGDCKGFGVDYPLPYPQKNSLPLHISSSAEGFSLRGTVKTACLQGSLGKLQVHQEQAPSWLQVSQILQEQTLRLSYLPLAFSEEKKLTFVWYLQAQKVLLRDKGKELCARTLDHYRGELTSVEFCGEKGEGKLQFFVENQAEMEIIPLSGERDFWGADFLLALHSPYGEQCEVDLSFQEKKAAKK